MDKYSFNGMQVGGVVVDMDDVGELRVGADRFRAIYKQKGRVNKDALEKVLPSNATFSNLRTIESESGARNRVRARGKVDQVVDVSGETVVLEGSVETFQLEPR